MYLSDAGRNHEVVLDPLSTSPGHAAHPSVFVVKGYDLIARKATGVKETSFTKPASKDIAEALFTLSEEYGISFPGVGSMAIRAHNNDSTTNGVYVYTTAKTVNGLNMHYDLAEVPLDATLSTFKKMLSYYEDMSEDYSSRQYLTDLSLRQCLFGRTQEDRQPEPYFVDYDPRLNNISNILLRDRFRYLGEGFAGIEGLDDDLYALKKTFPGRNFEEIAHRLLAIANIQGIFYKVPTAYNLVNSMRIDQI